MPQKHRNNIYPKKQQYNKVHQEDLDTESSGSYDEESLEDGRPDYVYRQASGSSSCCRGFCLGIVLTSIVMTLVLYGSMAYGIFEVAVDMEQVQTMVNNTMQSINQAQQSISKALPSKKDEQVDSSSAAEAEEKPNEPEGAAAKGEGSGTNAEEYEEPNAGTAQGEEGSDQGSAEGNEDPDADATQDEEGSEAGTDTGGD